MINESAFTATIPLNLHPSNHTRPPNQENDLEMSSFVVNCKNLNFDTDTNQHLQVQSLLLTYVTLLSNFHSNNCQPIFVRSSVLKIKWQPVEC